MPHDGRFVEIYRHTAYFFLRILAIIVVALAIIAYLPESSVPLQAVVFPHLLWKLHKKMRTTTMDITFIEFLCHEDSLTYVIIY